MIAAIPEGGAGTAMMVTGTLHQIGPDTPAGTPVLVVEDAPHRAITVRKTRSAPWMLGGCLVVMLTGRTGGYDASRCYAAAKLDGNPGAEGDQ